MRKATKGKNMSGNTMHGATDSTHYGRNHLIKSFPGLLMPIEPEGKDNFQGYDAVPLSLWP